MSMRQLHDLSRVYLESVASKPDYLDFDKDGNKKESMKKALKDKKEVTEAVRGQDTEMRRAASQERQKERKERGGAAPKIPGREGPSAGKTYADYQQVSMRAHDKATRGKFIPGMVKNESLDPVGQEDADIDNDGKSNTKSDKYLLNRRKVRGAAIKKESFSNWRQDLAEVMDEPESDTEDHKQIKEKKNINNRIVINPEFKEAVEELGGVLLETVELEEGYKPIGKEKETAMYRRAGNLARTSLSSRGKKKEEAQTKSAKIVSAITRQKEKERFDRIGQSPAHNEEVEYVDEAQKSFPFKKVEAQKEKARKGSVYGKDTGNKPVPQVSDKEKKETTRFSKMQSAYEKAKRAKQEADKSRRSSTFYKDTHPASAPKMKKANEEFELDERTLTSGETKKKEEIVKSMKKSAGDFEKRYPGRGKEVMYATATKMAKKVAEAVADQAALSPQELQKQKQKSTLDTQIAMLRKQSLSRTKKPEVTEAAEDRARDEHQMRGGMAARVDYDRPPAKKLSNKEMGVREFTPAEKEERRKQMAAHLKKMGRT